MKNQVIGVVTPSVRLFELWKQEVGYQTYGKDATFVILSRKEQTWGRSYYAVERGFKSDKVNPTVYDSAVLRIR